MSPRARAVLFCLAAAILFALPLLPEILGSRRLVFRDAQITHWPWRRVAMQQWKEGRAPLVNASASGGQPLLANPNASLLYPTFLLEAILPAASAFNLHYLLHVLWALLGARALALRLRLSDGPAFLSGVAYAFSGMMLSYGSAFLNSAAAAAWLPWCAAALLDLSRAESASARRRAAGAAAIAFGMQLLAGEPAISLLTVIFAGGLAAVSLLRPGGTRLRRWILFVSSSVAAVVGAAAIAAPLLLLLSGVLRFTYRGQHLYSERAFSASPFAAWRLVEWLFPRFSGDPGAMGAGGHWQYALHPGDLVYIWCVTLGVVPVLLVASAALLRDFWDRRARWLAAGGLASLLFAWGSALPFYRALFHVFFLRHLRYPIKFYLLTTISVALLTGLAAEYWKHRRSGRRPFFLLGAAALLYVLAFFAAGSDGPLERAVTPALAGLKAPAAALLPAIRESFRGDALLGLVAVAVVVIAIAPRKRARGEGYLLGLAVLLLALPWGLPLFVSAGQRDLERPPAVLSSIRGPGRLYISPVLPELNVLVSGTAHPRLPYRVSQFSRVQIEELIPDTGSSFGIRYLFDADPDGSYGFYNRVVGEALSASNPAQTCRMLRTYGARWILEDESSRLACTRPVTGFMIAGRRLVLSEFPRPLPELRWASRENRQPSLSGALARIRSEDFDPENEVVLPGPARGNAPTGGGTAALSVAGLEPDEAHAEVDAASPGYLLFSRTYFSAWKARIDGRPARIQVGNARDLAVAVPAGRHRVDFWYDRTPLAIGVCLQAAAALSILLAGLHFRRRRSARA